jgi:RND superfamily putative drug exporter
MSSPPGTGSLAAIPAGRRTKWLMLVVWLILIVVLGSFAGKLQGVEKNDAAARSR